MQHVKYILIGMANSCQRLAQSHVHRDKLVSLFRFDITKEEIMKCEAKLYDGKVILISSERDEYILENKLAIEKLLKADIVGFDTETKVVFSSPHVQLPTALVQLSVKDTVVLWRLRRDRNFSWRQFPNSLKQILEDKDIKKAGSATFGDRNQLYKEYGVLMTSIFDTQKMAKELGFVKLGLGSLTAQLFGWTISKKKQFQLSNWEATNLDPKQISYAATDAWASYLVFRELESLMESVGIKPTALQSSVQTVIGQQSKKDRQLFHSIDKKLQESSGGTSKNKKSRSRIRKRRLKDKEEMNSATYTVDNDNPFLIEDPPYYVHDPRPYQVPYRLHSDGASSSYRFHNDVKATTELPSHSKDTKTDTATIVKLPRLDVSSTQSPFLYEASSKPP